LYLKTEYWILIRTGSQCRKAVALVTISGCLGIIHKDITELRSQVKTYVQRFLATYDHATVPLPLDGSLPQPVLRP
jgi:hypothetical protein